MKKIINTVVEFLFISTLALLFLLFVFVSSRPYRLHSLFPIILGASLNWGILWTIGVFLRQYTLRFRLGEVKSYALQIIIMFLISLTGWKTVSFATGNSLAAKNLTFIAFSSSLCIMSFVNLRTRLFETIKGIREKGFIKYFFEEDDTDFYE